MGLEFELEYRTTVSLAVQQGAVPLVHSLELRNPTGDFLTNLQLSLEIEGGLLRPWTTGIAGLPPGASWKSTTLDLRLSPEALVTVSERYRSSLVLKVAQDGAPFEERSWPLDVLAYNEWTGVESLPELLASFCLPNHPAVADVLKGARELLQQWSGDPSLSGYQTRSNERAALTAAAIYGSLQNRGLTYLGVPASFEVGGQKIRTPDQLLEQQMGNCLDITCMVAAALEQAGLHALLVLTEGHAFPGVWLNEESCSGTFVDDPALLRKSIDLGILALFDSSTLCAVPRQPFEAACRVAREHLNDLRWACDLTACRRAGIRPLPLRLASDGKVSLLVAEEQPLAAPNLSVPRPAPTRRPERVDRESWEKRLERWKNRLLDLTLRNKLLSFREGSKSMLPVLTSELGKLEDMLVAGKSLTLLPRPNLDNDPRSRALAVKQTGEDFLDTEVREQLQRGVLLVDLTAEELDKRQIEISRTARTTEEETGAKILFLALGFLEWFETEQSSQSRWAPLLLLPVDLVRSPGREPFKIRLRDEDTRVNLTLLQKLKQDFRLEVDHLAEMPEDESGYDVPAILQSFRALVLNTPRWQVHARARLGLFSFNKLLMWQDLQESPELLKRNPMLKELLSGRLTRVGSGGINERELDEARPASNCLCVLDADSSQLSALQTADRGDSFVLQGPPGTGKSQTITNLIANTIAQGRSVLFVAEKLAALQVVHHRLEQAGLLPFCLELHSNKANKLQILQQLKEAQDVAGPSSEGRFRQSAEDVQAMRRELNTYVECLHRPREIGRSVFQALARFSALEGAPGVRFSLPAHAGEEYLQRGRRELAELTSLTQTLGVPAQHLWRHSYLEQTGRQVQQDAEVALQSARSALESLDLAVLQLPAIPTRERIDKHGAVLRLLVDAPSLPKELLLAESWRETEARCGPWIEKGRQRQAAWATLDEQFTPGLLELDLDRLLEQYRRWASVVLFGWFMLWAPRRRLRKAARKALAAAAKVTANLEKAIEVRQLDQYFEQQKSAIERSLGWLWEGPATDWSRVEASVAWVAAFRSAVADAGRPDWLQRPLGEEKWTKERSFLAAWDMLASKLMALEQTLQLRDWLPTETSFSDSLREWLEQRQGQLGLLREWALYRQKRREIEAGELGLEAVLLAHWEGTVAASDLEDSFERSFLESWLDRVHSEDPVLSRFQGHRQTSLVNQFRQRDAELLGLSRQQVFATLAARVPDPDREYAANSEAAVLRKELKKQRRHKSPRRLFVEIKNLLPRLKPCIMMSPLSVAQYLDPSLPPFDLVVFDEASQVAPWDALGALARGNQWIVVGDSKQLPPSNFFGKTDQTDESFEDTDEELESILDECEGSGLRQQSLKWHYRSRHEELIVFSNRRYYENKLLTFPCNDTGRSVHFRYVEGSFDRGASRTNRAEAEAVVAELLARLRQGDRSSFGIVTFNQAQQGLIEDLLDLARRDEPQLEPYFTSVEEPVFIKNLENVQGDERDVILFSVGYGPDSQGRFYMNFGPLNLQGGQRRLNVAVSRARQEMVVFSSMRSDDLDLSRSRARGVADLKGFLAFAERGTSALDAEVTGTGEEYESPFEAAVGRALEGRGWVLHKQVGCSGYRIDLAVVDPRQPGRYLLGIECDGASYHSAATARDRDRLRASVLAGLGWELERVWSTDWWHDAGRELDRLHDALERAAVRPVATTPVIPVPTPAPVRVSVAIQAAPAPARPALPTFSAAVLTNRLTSFEPHLIPLEQFEPPLAELLVEAPVRVARAERALLGAFGVKRLGARVQARVQEALARARRLGRAQVHGDALWRPDQDPSAYDEFRVGGRDLEDVPLVELVNATLWVLKDSGSLPAVDLRRAVARTFGVSRLGAKVEARAQEAVDSLLAQGRIRDEEGRLVWR